MDIRTNPPSWLQWEEQQIQAENESSREYKYIYGVKDIQVMYKEFSEASVYVSKPFTIDGNVVEVSLEAEEYNPAISTLNRNINPFDTAVEYYVAFSENPTVDDWKPILPQSTQLINELLLFRSAPICELRFKCDTSKEISVYKNGIKLDRQYWSYGANNAISIDKRFDKYAIYTVHYFPDIDIASPWDISLSEREREIVPYLGPDGSSGEVFRHGTDRNGEIFLSKHPYIDYSRINTDTSYSPIKVSLENTNIIGPLKKPVPYIDAATSPVKTKNITDYKYLSEPILKPYDISLNSSNVPTNPIFEYYQDGRKLYFTETFNNSHIVSNMETNHGDAVIRVNYEYLRAKIRLKVILRNISNKDNAVTPVVRGYNLIFKVMR